MIINLLLFLASAFCLGYGLKKYLGKKVALFSILVVASFTCFMTGHLFDIISILTDTDNPDMFNIGMLARLGGFAFVFSASFAQMDGLVDGHQKGLMKYRIIPLIAPLAIMGMYVFIAQSNLGISAKIAYLLVFAFSSASAYYNLKHLIIPDVSLGIIASIRAYCALMLLSNFCYCIMTVAKILDYTYIYYVFAVLLAVSYPTTVIAMEKGRKKWTT